MSKQSKEIKQLIQKTAVLEQFVFLVQTAHKQADYHASEVVERSVTNANSALSQSVKELAKEEVWQAERLLNVAWFYAKFAQDILVAEATEHLLGQDQFLELIQSPEQTKKRLNEILNRLHKRLDSYQALAEAQGNASEAAEES